MKSKISYSEKSSIGLVILAIAFIFEEDLVKYELVCARWIILKVVSLVYIGAAISVNPFQWESPQKDIYLAVIESFIFTEYLSVSASEQTKEWKFTLEM